MSWPLSLQMRELAAETVCGKKGLLTPQIVPETLRREERSAGHSNPEMNVDWEQRLPAIDHNLIVRIWLQIESISINW